LKRGAIIAMIIMAIIWYIYERRQRRFEGTYSPSRKRIVAFFAVILVIIVSIWVNIKTNGSLAERFSFESMLDGSTRYDIYSNAIEEIKDRNIVTLIFGTGSGSSSTYVGSGIHNEILDLIISYGFIGALLYIITFFSGLNLIWKKGREKNMNISVFAASFAYIFLVGIWGSALFSHMTFHIMLTMGLFYIDGKKSLEVANDKKTEH